MRPLAAKRRTLALDLLGFGASDKPFIGDGIQTRVDFLGDSSPARRSACRPDDAAPAATSVTVEIAARVAKIRRSSNEP